MVMLKQPQVSHLIFNSLTDSVLLLGDSIPKYVTDIRGPKNKCLRGANIGKIADYLTFMVPEDRDHLQAKAIILHVGTNDIVPGNSAIQIAKSYKVLLNVIKFHFPTANVYCSAILPRPCDAVLTAYLTKLVNKLLCVTAERTGCLFIESFKPFLLSGNTRRDLFAKDGLHPNGLGQFALTTCLRLSLAPKNQVAVAVRTRNLAKRWAENLISAHYPVMWEGSKSKVKKTVTPGSLEYSLSSSG